MTSPIRSRVNLRPRPRSFPSRRTKRIRSNELTLRPQATRRLKEFEKFTARRAGWTGKTGVIFLDPSAPETYFQTGTLIQQQESRSADNWRQPSTKHQNSPGRKILMPSQPSPFPQPGTLFPQSEEKTLDTDLRSISDEGGLKLADGELMPN